MSELKTLIYNQLKDQLIGKVEEIRSAIEAAKDSRDQETKSSVGDKHETGRAMVQAELDKYQSQLYEVQKQQLLLNSIDIHKTQLEIEAGSLIHTNEGKYFLLIGAGKVQHDEETVYVISPASPMGQLLLGKKTGDTVQFQGRDIRVVDIA